MTQSRLEVNSMKYNYYEAVKNDAIEYIKENNLQDKSQEELYAILKVKMSQKKRFKNIQIQILQNTQK